jgi:hypothetical protein
MIQLYRVQQMNSTEWELFKNKTDEFVYKH